MDKVPPKFLELVIASLQDDSIVKIVKIVEMDQKQSI